MGFVDQVKHAWNAFTNDRHDSPSYYEYGSSSYGSNPGRSTFRFTNDRSMVGVTIMRLAIDVAKVNMFHARIDDNGYFVETIDSGLNNCLTVEANLDQEARAFRQDVVMTMCDKGVVAIVPTDTSISPLDTGGFDIKKLRVGEIITWYPNKVTVRVYNEVTGLKEDITLPKAMVCIIENPLSAVMNDHNSTLQRLVRKLNILDAIDEQSGSGKIDIIIQMPYAVKSEARKQQAEQRRNMLEDQMRNSKYGVGYIDATEKITQLNRPAENNLLAQVEYLTGELYGQLGITEEVMKGTADEQTMINYYNRTIEPILAAVAGGMKRTFLTKTARSQKQSIVYLQDPFRLVPVSSMADMADKFTRNEIMSSNEIRGVLGIRPSKDPKADELRNKNIPAPEEENTEQPAASGPVQLEQPKRSLAIESGPGSRVKKIMEGQVKNQNGSQG